VRTQTTGAVLASVPEFGSTTPAEVIGTDDHAARIAAAQAAGAHAFVCELPEGYHTPVGQGGVVLTASQRLRLSVAGLLTADPAATVGASAAVTAAVAWSAGPGAGPRPPDLPDDPALPSLGMLLDARAMAPLLGRTLGVLAEEDDPDMRVHSVRYKPGDNVVVQYSVLTRAGWRTAVAFSRAGSRLHRQRRSQVNRKLARRVADRVPAPKALVYLPEVQALVQWMPLDIRLPVLADQAERLTERLAKKGLDAAGAEPKLLRYWPRRRAVLRLGPYVLKVYRDRADFDQARRALGASAALTRVRTPAYVGRLKARQVTVQEWVPGHTPSLLPGSSEVAGAVLADLHGDQARGLPATPPAAILDKARVRADFVTVLLPELRSEVAALLGDLTGRLPHDIQPVTSHGNFHGGQLLSGPSGLTTLDVDRMCRAAPAYDLASYAAHLAFGRPGDLEVLAAAVDSLVTGYGSRPRGLEWYLSTYLLRRAAVPFRFQDDQWPAAATELVRLARMVLR
jgi:hypothetical protein